MSVAAAAVIEVPLCHEPAPFREHSLLRTEDDALFAMDPDDAAMLVDRG